MSTLYAGLLQWFQVTCPSCAQHLQVKLPEGITSVQCSECKGVFAVQVQPAALQPSLQSGAAKRSRKRKIEKEGSGAPGVPRALSAYNVFMKAEVAKVKAANPDLLHRDAFKQAAEGWQASPMNPQNGGERFPETAQEEQAAAETEYPLDEEPLPEGEPMGIESTAAESTAAEAAAAEATAASAGESTLQAADSGSAGADGVPPAAEPMQTGSERASAGGGAGGEGGDEAGVEAGGEAGAGGAGGQQTGGPLPSAQAAEAGGGGDGSAAEEAQPTLGAV